MAKVRVYELAKELGVESKALLAHLKEQGEFVRSASSTIEAPVVRKIKESWASTSQAVAAAPAARTSAPAPAAPSAPCGRPLERSACTASGLRPRGARAPGDQRTGHCAGNGTDEPCGTGCTRRPSARAEHHCAPGPRGAGRRRAPSRGRGHSGPVGAPHHGSPERSDPRPAPGRRRSRGPRHRPRPTSVAAARSAAPG